MSTHLSKLADAGYVAIQKEFVENIPRTLIRLTGDGRSAIQSYRENMRRVVDGLLGSEK